MNRLFTGLGLAACLAFAGTAGAANGGIAASMARDYWIAVKKNEERAQREAAMRLAAAEAALIRPPADTPRRVR